MTGFPAYKATTAYVRALAQRTEQDADTLTDAFEALQSGDALTDAQAARFVALCQRRAAGDQGLGALGFELGLAGEGGVEACHIEVGR